MLRQSGNHCANILVNVNFTLTKEGEKYVTPEWQSLR